MTQPIKDTLAALDLKILKLQAARDTLAAEFCNAEQTDWPIRPMGIGSGCQPFPQDPNHTSAIPLTFAEVIGAGAVQGIRLK